MAGRESRARTATCPRLIRRLLATYHVAMKPTAKADCSSRHADLPRPFWAAFEELASEFPPCGDGKTQTRAREEADQRFAATVSPTLTKTATREEDDQDPGGSSFGAIPRATLTETQTITKTREEQDQDPSNSGLRALLLSSLAGTRTLTEQREEPDQDDAVRRFAAIPSAERD